MYTSFACVKEILKYSFADVDLPVKVSPHPILHALADEEQSRIVVVDVDEVEVVDILVVYDVDVVEVIDVVVVGVVVDVVDVVVITCLHTNVISYVPLPLKYLVTIV